MNLAVYLSGTGSNFKSIAASIVAGRLPARIALVVSNKADAAGLAAAREMTLPTAVFDRDTYLNGDAFADAMMVALKSNDVDFIVLAGYMRKLPPRVVRSFAGSIVNIHPALLPRFGGKGMYGMNVHQAVIDAGEIEGGVTIHYVDEMYDHGDIIAQRRVPVLAGDTAESLRDRVLEQEHIIYSEVLRRLALKKEAGAAA